MYFSVDRIIKGKAMLIGEDRKPLEVSLSLLPPGTKSGDMLIYTNSGKFIQAEERARERREGVAEMLGILLKAEDDKNEKD